MNLVPSLRIENGVKLRARDSEGECVSVPAPEMTLARLQIHPPDCPERAFWFLRSRDMRQNTIGGVLFMAIGGIFLYFAWVSASNTRAFHATALQAQGQVVGYKESWSKDDNGRTSVSYYPIITFIALRTAQRESLEYRVDAGHKVTFTAGVGGSQRYGIGETVSVSYQPDDPENARLDSFVQNWLLATILGAFGFAFGGAGLLILRD